MNVYKLQNLRQNDVVLDLGAGIGEFSLASSRLVGPNGFVLAVEPNPEDFKTLVMNIKKNNITNILALNYAFSDSNKTLSLSFKGTSYNASAINCDEIIRILRENGKETIDVIKMDIEGAEVAALRNRKPILPNIRIIAIELHGTDSKVHTILEPFGFIFSRFTKLQYIFSSLKFASRHPLTAMKLWKLFKKTGENPGLLKIAKGVDISISTKLSVGIYARN